MKKALFSLIFLASGLCVGGAAAFGTSRILGGRPLVSMESPKTFLPIGPITVPLVSADGRLSGYILVESQLEVPGKRLEDVRTRLPLLLDAITMRSFKTPMASGPDGMLPNLYACRHLLQQAVTQVYGNDAILRIAITRASPI